MNLPEKNSYKISGKLKITLMTCFFISSLILLKVSYRTADVGYFKVFLYPAASLVSLTTGIDFDFEKNRGYVSTTGKIVINKTCSGINFFITVLSFSFLFFYILKARKKAGFYTLPLIILSGYILTILANTSRITLSIVMADFQNRDFLAEYYQWIHYSVGAVVFLVYFILYYVLLDKGTGYLLKYSTTKEAIRPRGKT